MANAYSGVGDLIWQIMVTVCGHNVASISWSMLTAGNYLAYNGIQ